MATTELILLCKIASLQFLRPESEGFKQNLEGLVVAGALVPPSTSLSKIYFDKLSAARGRLFVLQGLRPAHRRLFLAL